jgi:type I restriction enzyme S subunit
MNRAMKDSGVKWIGEIPQDWEILKVKDVFYRKNTKAEVDNPIVLSLARDAVKIRDISNNEGQLAESYYNYNPVEIDDLLLNPMDLYSGANCSLSKVQGVISPAYINLRYKENNSPRFYDYYFKTQYWSMVLFAHGKGISFDNRWTLNFDTINRYLLPYPIPKEQHAIANFLDNKCEKIDRLIALQEEMIEELKAYKQSVITEAVTKGLDPTVPMKDSGIEWIGEIPKTWAIVKMKYLGTAFNGLTYKPEDISNENEGILVLRSSNVQNGKITLDDNVYVNSKISERLLLRKNDILICSRNGSKSLIGKNALIENDISATFGAFMMIFRTRHAQYVHKVLNSNLFSFYLSTFLTATINQLILSNFNNMEIVFTNNLKEQQEIADYLDKKCADIDNLISIKQSKIDELKEYKKSMIYEYVTGKKEVI